MNRLSSTSDASAADMVSGINVTPLVDITLVLLIIFMVTAKVIASQALPMDLPKESPGQEIRVVLGVELRANGDLVVDGERLPNDDSILAIAREAHARSSQLQVVVRADSAVPHGRVIRVLDRMKQAGITKIAFGAHAAASAAAGGVQPAPAGVKP